MYCRNCGKAFLEEDKFCTNCGTAVTKGEINQEIVAKHVKEPRSEYKNMLIKAVLIAIAICVLLQVWFILTGEMWDVHFRVWGSVWWIIAYGVVASIGINLYERTNNKSLAIGSLILAAVGFVFSTLFVWGVLSNEEFVWRAMLVLWLTSFGLAHSSRLMIIKFKSQTALNTLYITNIILFITYSMGILMIMFEINSEIFARIYLVFVILALFGTVATALVNRIQKINTDESLNNLEINNEGFSKKYKNRGFLIMLVIFGLLIIGLGGFVGFNLFTPGDELQNCRSRIIEIPFAIKTIPSGTEITPDLVGRKRVCLDELNPSVIQLSQQIMFRQTNTTITEGDYFQTHLLVPINDNNNWDNHRPITTRPTTTRPINICPNNTHQENHREYSNASDFFNINESVNFSSGPVSYTNIVFENRFFDGLGTVTLGNFSGTITNNTEERVRTVFYLYNREQQFIGRRYFNTHFSNNRLEVNIHEILVDRDMSAGCDADNIAYFRIIRLENHENPIRVN